MSAISSYRSIMDVEAQAMHRQKRDLWKAGITITGMLLLLALMLVVWLPVSTASAYQQGASATPVTEATVTVRPTPTEDATVTALNKEKLVQEVQQLKNQSEPDVFVWLRVNASILLVGIGGLFGLFRYLRDQRIERGKQREDRQMEREKRSEERFQSVVEGLGSTSPAAQAGAAIMLRTFLQSGYEQFYRQAFDLAVANLRLRQVDPDKPELLNSLSQALITAFKESFPLARNELSQNDNEFESQSLDATGIQLDSAYLREADLDRVWMPVASLRKVNLSGAKLIEANLSGADLRGAYLIGAKLDRARLRGTDLSGADLSGADLIEAKLSEANLSGADLSGGMRSRPTRNRPMFSGALSGTRFSDRLLSGADLSGADLSGANLSEANLKGTNLYRTDLSRADLSRADLSGANLSEADFSGARLNGAKLGVAKLAENAFFEADLSRADLSRADLSEADFSGARLNGANCEDALSLKNTNLRGVVGLTKEQLATCKAKGAIIDEDPTTSASQSTVAPPPPAQSNDSQASSVPPVQGDLPTPDASGSNAPSSNPGSGS